MKHNLKNRVLYEGYMEESYEEFIARNDRWFEGFEKELREKYAKLCETRIGNVEDDAVAFFIEELLDAEAEEILGEED